MSFLLRSGTEVKTPRAMTSRSILANHSSIWLSQEEYVGVKCSCTLGFWARNASTRVVLCAERLSAITWNLFAVGLVGHDVGQEGDELGRGMAWRVLPNTSPVLVLNAAYRERVP